MKGNRRFSLMDRFVSGKSRATRALHGAHPTDDQQQGAPAVPPLKGSALEQAYRELMLENHVLAETNERLHERLARIEAGLEESPAAKQLIRAQRNALAERSHRLRETQYENLNLKREKNKLIKENRKLAASLARRMEDIQPLLNQEEDIRRELEAAKAALREKSNELAKLTDRYYQLEARAKPYSNASGGF